MQAQQMVQKDLQKGLLSPHVGTSVSAPCLQSQEGHAVQRRQGKHMSEAAGTLTKDRLTSSMVPEGSTLVMGTVIGAVSGLFKMPWKAWSSLRAFTQALCTSRLCSCSNNGDFSSP